MAGPIGSPRWQIVLELVIFALYLQILTSLLRFL